MPNRLQRLSGKGVPAQCPRSPVLRVRQQNCVVDRINPNVAAIELGIVQPHTVLLEGNLSSLVADMEKHRRRDFGSDLEACIRNSVNHLNDSRTWQGKPPDFDAKLSRQLLRS